MAIFQKRYARIWLIAGGALMVFGVLFGMLVTGGSVNWEATPGQVTAVAVHGPVLPTGMVTVVIDYQYEINNRVYVGSGAVKIAGDGSSLHEHYAAGSGITVYINPKAPLQSTLSPQDALTPGSLGSMAGPAILAGLPFVAIGLGLALFGTNQSASKKLRQPAKKPRWKKL